MPCAITDLYSEKLYKNSMGPCFHNYYNIEFRDGFSMPVHSHEYIEIMYIKKGICDVYVEENRHRMEAGDFILMNGFVPHKLHIDSNLPCKVLCLEFNFTFCSESLNAVKQAYSSSREVRLFLRHGKSAVKLKDSVDIYTNLSDIYRELEQDVTGPDIYIESSFCTFLIKLARLFNENEKIEKSPVNKYINAAISYMSSRYYEELNVESVARHVNLNISYFHKIFKGITGLTPLDFLNGIRINKAKSLLEKTSIPVIDICNFVGFNSRQYFTSAFKKHVKVTPSEYRKNYQMRKDPGNVNSFCYDYLSKQ